MLAWRIIDGQSEPSPDVIPAMAQDAGATTDLGGDLAPRVTLNTTMGAIVLELDSELAPNTVNNFLAYVDAGHYSGTLFHRVIDGFMIQGGGFDPSYNQKPVNAPIENEATTDHKNLRGTVAMARTNEPHSATSQFFINVVDNGGLDHVSPTTAGWGYAVFGRVVEGMEIVDAIKSVATGPAGPFSQDAPLVQVVIESATR